MSRRRLLTRLLRMAPWLPAVATEQALVEHYDPADHLPTLIVALEDLIGQVDEPAQVAALISVLAGPC